MAFTIKNNEKIAVSREETQGVYVAPAASNFVLPLADGIELNPAKELLDRDILTPNIGQILPRTGIRSVSGTIGVEARSSSTEGARPEQGLLVEAALGSINEISDEGSIAAGTFALGAKTFTITGATYSVNDIIMIKFPGAFHITPITAVSGTSVTVLVGLPAQIVAAGATTVAATSTYKAANSGHPSFSVTKEVEGDLVEEGLGCRVSSYALENFTTGQLPTETFGVDGLTYEWTTGGADFVAADSLQFNIANAGDGDGDSLSVSVNGGTGTVFTFDTTPAAGQFSTVAGLAVLLNGITGLEATVNAVSTDEIDLVATQKEGGSIVITTTSGDGTNPWNKLTVSFAATSPVFETSLPPVVLEACVYQDDKRVIVNEVAFTVENSLGYITSTCDANGRISSRVTARATTGTFNPYKTASVDGDQTEAVTLEQFNLFNNNVPYSLFLYAANPILSANVPVSGEFSQVVAYYMPSCLSTEIPEGDADDVLQYNISFQASSGTTGGDADIIAAYI